MDINTHVDSIVQNIIGDITSKVQAQVSDLITEKIDQVIGTMDFGALVTDRISKRLDDKIDQLPIDKNSMEVVLNSRVESIAQNLSKQVQQSAIDSINETVTNYVNQLDFASTYQSSVIAAIKNQQIIFPPNSIPSNALSLEKLVITGDHIQGGIITGFGSTGIDDRASQCQLTIMDDVTVVENNLLTQDLTVKGTVNIEGDLNVTGTVPESSALFQKIVTSTANQVRSTIDEILFKSYAKLVLDDIKTSGLDLNKITLNGQEIINGNTLGNFVLNSNLQKVGQLKELQVSGESLLSDTLYTSGKRVGINTIEPNSVLSIWDQEVEVSIGKKTSNAAIIETPRKQQLILSSNAQNNLTLNPDGSISVNEINLGNMAIASSSAPPTDNKPIGYIVFNSSPSLGGPIGWVSLGDARWGNFGIID